MVLVKSRARISTTGDRSRAIWPIGIRRVKGLSSGSVMSFTNRSKAGRPPPDAVAQDARLKCGSIMEAKERSILAMTRIYIT